MLGSSTMLRVLAGVYFEVRSSRGGSGGGLLRKLSNHTAAPIDVETASGRLWANCGSQESFIRYGPWGSSADV